MKKLKKNTLENFVKTDCFLYSKGLCAALKGAKENNSSFKTKCEPTSICKIGIEIKEFVDSIRTPDINTGEQPSTLSRYLS